MITITQELYEFQFVMHIITFETHHFTLIWELSTKILRNFSSLILIISNGKSFYIQNEGTADKLPHTKSQPFQLLIINLPLNCWQTLQHQFSKILAGKVQIL